MYGVMVGISIHAPREGRDENWAQYLADVTIFQSTRPARGATAIFKDRESGDEFQSTRPARGATTKGASTMQI